MDIAQLMSLDSTPLAYLVDDNESLVETRYGKVPVGAALGYQVYSSDYALFNKFVMKIC